MKKLFKSEKTYEPLDYKRRKYFENNFICLNQDFPEPALDERKVLVPSETDFPVKWNGSEENALECLKIVSQNMQIDFNELELDLYSEGIRELNSGASSVYLENDPDQESTGGLYFGKNGNGKYEISLNRHYLNEPEVLIGTIAHELAHVKLMGENKIEVNDEMLTDLATVFFGLGVFTANSSFRFHHESDRWGYSSSGYLTVDEWSYSLALFAFSIYEEDPEWSVFLNPTIKKEFQRCLKYMLENEDEIFNF